MRLIIALAVAGVLGVGSDARVQPARAKSVAKLPADGSNLVARPWTGDFDGMVKRRLIRALVMPATGKDMGVGDIHELAPNIHAGVKYIRFMIDRYYAKEPMDRLNKGLFAFASYNAGPARVQQLREAARKRGLDPNAWFDNVEVIAAEKIGRETAQFVSNIYKPS